MSTKRRMRLAVGDPFSRFRNEGFRKSPHVRQCWVLRGRFFCDLAESRNKYGLFIRVSHMLFETSCWSGAAAYARLHQYRVFCQSHIAIVVVLSARIAEQRPVCG